RHRQETHDRLHDGVGRRPGCERALGRGLGRLRLRRPGLVPLAREKRPRPKFQKQRSVPFRGMIKEPAALLVLFCGIILSVQAFSRTGAGQKFFKYLPVPLWCYFIPTLLSTCGLIPSESPFYSQLSRNVLPACLVLILVGTHLPSILKLGKKALIAMFLGS